MAKTNTPRVSFSVPTLVTLILITAAASGAFWRMQGSIDSILVELKNDREKLNTHLVADIIRRPADVREALRTP